MTSETSIVLLWIRVSLFPTSASKKNWQTTDQKLITNVCYGELSSSE